VLLSTSVEERSKWPGQKEVEEEEEEEETAGAGPGEGRGRVGELQGGPVQSSPHFGATSQLQRAV